MKNAEKQRKKQRLIDGIGYEHIIRNCLIKKLEKTMASITMFIALFIGWILPLTLGTYIGSRKDEGIISFILLFFFGWLWFPFVLMSRGKRKRCKMCFEWIHKRAGVCPKCHTEC